MVSENEIICLLKSIYPRAMHYWVSPPLEGKPLTKNDIRGKWRCGFVDSLNSPKHAFCLAAPSLVKLARALRDYGEDDWEDGKSARWSGRRF